MRSRGLVVALALLLAIGATAAVFLYVNSVKEEAKTSGDRVTVVVADQDIAANTQLNPLIDQGVFEPRDVPADSLVSGAVQDVEQLRGTVTTAAILAGEQIPLARVGSAQAPGGSAGLREGYQAVTFKFEGEQYAAEFLRPGDFVTVYAGFSDVQLNILPTSLDKLLKGKPAGGPAGQSQSSGVTTVQLGDFAVVLVSEARVLGITTQVQNQTGGQDTEPTIVQLVTLELEATDAQNAVFTQINGKLWLGLIRPGDTPPEAGTATQVTDFLGTGK